MHQWDVKIYSDDRSRVMNDIYELLLLPLFVHWEQNKV